MLPDGTLRIVGRDVVGALRAFALDSAGLLPGCIYPDPALILSPGTIVDGALLTIGGGGVGGAVENFVLHEHAAYPLGAVTCTGGGVLHLSGSTFLDIDSDGYFDGGEPCWPFHAVNVEPGATQVYTGSDCGFDHIIAQPGTFTIAPAPANPWWALSSDSVTYTITHDGTDSTVTGIDFGFVPAYDTAVFVASTPSGTIDCMGIVHQFIHVLNTGTVPGDVLIAVQFDPSLSFIASDPVADSVVDGNNYWHLSALGSFQNGLIDVLLDPPGSDDEGETLASPISVLVMDDGAIIAVDSLTWAPLVTCAYDPNTKSVVPQGDGPDGLVPVGTEWFTYTIRFQNTGTDTAFVVVVQDQLSPNLDWSAIEVLGGSHTITGMSLTAGGLLEFRFENILLPDSGANEPASHGHILFRARPITGIAHLDVIENDAAIFFDQNTPVITNQVRNTWYDCTGNSTTLGLEMNGNQLAMVGENFYLPVHWYLNGELIPDEEWMFIADPEPGDYQVLMTDVDGCLIWSDVFTVISTGVLQAMGNEMRIIPNPMSTSARLVLSEPLGPDGRVELVDASGRVLRVIRSIGSREVLIERGHLESGMYVLRVMRGGEHIGSARIVIH